MSSQRTGSLLLDRMEQGNPASPASPSDESAAPPARVTVNVSPEPRLTVSVWRVFNTVILLAFASYKAFGPKQELTDLDWILGGLWAAYAYWIGNVEQDNPGVAPWLFTHDLSFVRTALAELSTAVSSPFVQIPIFVGAFFPSGPTRTFAAYLWLYGLALICPFFVFISLRGSARLGFLWRDTITTDRELALVGIATLCDIGVATLLLLFFDTPTQNASYWLAICFMVGTIASVAVAYGAISVYPSHGAIAPLPGGGPRREERAGEEEEKKY
ncbi:hypothetical protein B0H16DRAFT_106517 [Mycena metata]|uniref:Uncharacterized protein n=1 Tax=Mycena metata TaxID=1033252 RepID=A0AAD7IA94_9AGAR|nr:hypothetical protein B0H16DRAFT_106517 [Mycena metata]